MIIDHNNTNVASINKTETWFLIIKCQAYVNRASYILVWKNQDNLQKTAQSKVQNTFINHQNKFQDEHAHYQRKIDNITS